MTERSNPEASRIAVEALREKLRQAEDRAAQAEAREAELREALEPFAREAEEWNEETRDDFPPMVGEEDASADACFTVGDLRRASRLLSLASPSPVAEAMARVVEAALRLERLEEEADALAGAGKVGSRLRELETAIEEAHHELRVAASALQAARKGEGV